ncbi:hypothetical protein T4B_8870 [Trichinella pseudospiralis]|uniref:Uncharacterized protein n=1 Tax=Trichinella pseudospiralis TaxID=6337 RepID=A0A0V1EHL6_TRIPS|nr:hypothetical protein T4A_8182 [Trichinella pseudospiralis]KRZ35116.1 hypothetical protein T4B_8870 [Trichinella pseudospiralis]KRZ44090.1 hypothetical protein T4C_5043 [Trichinella pseudospiralis]
MPLFFTVRYSTEPLPLDVGSFSRDSQNVLLRGVNSRDIDVKSQEQLNSWQTKFSDVGVIESLQYGSQ